VPLGSKNLERERLNKHKGLEVTFREVDEETRESEQVGGGCGYS